MADSRKQVRSPSSSGDESDPSNKDDEGSGGSAVRRSFECTYCRRGFTNAQALGGHMNIHRKDRAKAKQTTTTAMRKQASYNYADDQNYIVSCRQSAPFPSNSHTDVGYTNWESQRITAANHHHMYRPVASVPDQILNLPVAAGSYEPLRHSEHHQLGSNLSFRVGSAASVWNINNNDEDQQEENDDDEDVDLELRLGPR